jgi:plasmid stabilization system protein ParE
MRVVVDAKAWTDLDQIDAWIAKDNPHAAREILRRIVASIEAICTRQCTPHPMIVK